MSQPSDPKASEVLLLILYLSHLTGSPIYFLSTIISDPPIVTRVMPRRLQYLILILLAGSKPLIIR